VDANHHFERRQQRNDAADLGGCLRSDAIALEIEKIAPPRPMTHDLLRNLIVELGLTVDRV